MLDQVRLSVHASQPDAAFVAGQVAVFMAKRVSSWIKYGSESGLFDASGRVVVDRFAQRIDIRSRLGHSCDRSFPDLSIALRGQPK